jgi:hypothetical protein
MFYSKRFIPHLLLPLGLIGVSALGTSPLPLKSVSKNVNASAKSSKPIGNSDGSIFSEIIPAELEQQVTVRPSWMILSRQLSLLQDSTKVSLTFNPSIPNDPLFIAAPYQSEFAILHQIRLLLTDDQWRIQWSRKDLNDSSNHSYRLWKEAIKPQERRAKMVQAAKERLEELLALIQAGPQAWDALRKEDPEMSNDIRQPILQAPLLLVSQLSPDQLDTILMGQPLTLPIEVMSPENQSLVRKSFGTIQATNINGTKIVFSSHLLDHGKLGLSMSTQFPTQPNSFMQDLSLGGFEMLYMADPDFVPDEKQKIEAQHRQEAWDALAAQTPGSKTVTIDAAAKPEPGEPQLAAYLRAFAEQTKLTVLAHWPADSKAPDKKLPASIVGKPAGEALDILCKTCDGEWVQDEKTVRLRALPAKDSAPKKPTVAAPASATVGSGLSR